MTVGVVGKYIRHNDAYKSIYESLDHAGIADGARVVIARSKPRRSSAKGPSALLSGLDGVLVPGGFDYRGSRARSTPSAIAREREVPFFGICLGLQCAVIEFARNVLASPDANSTEFDRDTPHPVDLHARRAIRRSPTRAARCGWAHIRALLDARQPRARRPTAIRWSRERHRHRYEFNNQLPHPIRGGTAWSSPAPARTASWSRSSNCATIPGSWPCSSIRSSSRSRPRRIRCSAASSKRRSTGTNRGCR